MLYSMLHFIYAFVLFAVTKGHVSSEVGRFYKITTNLDDEGVCKHQD